MKKIFLTSIAAPFLATGAAHATENYYVQCGRKLVNVFGHHGYSFSEIINGEKGRELPARAFRFDRDGKVYFRGRKCFCIPWEETGVDKCPNRMGGASGWPAWGSTLSKGDRVAKA